MVSELCAVQTQVIKCVQKKKKKKNITKQYWHTVSLEYMWKNCILLQLTGEGTETQSARLIYRGI